MRLLVLSFLLVLSNSFTSNAFLVKDPSKGTSTLNVYFDTDRAVLSEDEKTKIDRIFADQTLETIKISLVGHTDDQGSDAYNIRLSKRRVERVRKYLIGLGYDSDKIEIAYKGEAQPRANNDQDEGRAQNRRVTIDWEFKEPAPKEEVGDIRDLYKLLEQEKQEFCINPNRDTILTLNQGTIVVIPAGSFKSGTAGCVTFKTKEIYKTSDMLLENLTTTSNGMVLETGGMIYTEAFDANGNALDIEGGKEITMLMPTKDPKENMQLFSGQRQNGLIMNWSNPVGQIPYFNFGYCNDWGGYSNDDNDNSCEYEPLFFKRFPKRIGNSFKGAFNKTTRAGNKSYRECQKGVRKQRKITKKAFKTQGIDGDLPTRYSLPQIKSTDTVPKTGMFAQYDVNTYAALRDTLCKIQDKQMQDFLDKWGVSSMDEYYGKMRELEEQRKEEERKKMESDLAEGKASVSDLQYYSMSITGTGWANCDVWSPWGNAAPRNDVNFNTFIGKYKSYFDCRGEKSKYSSN